MLTNYGWQIAVIGIVGTLAAGLTVLVTFALGVDSRGDESGLAQGAQPTATAQAAEPTPDASGAIRAVREICVEAIDPIEPVTAAAIEPVARANIENAVAEHRGDKHGLV